VNRSNILRSVMKAVRVTEFGAPDVCKVAQIAKPTPASKQVLIKTEYSGLNPVDTYMRSGNYARLPDLPYTPGSDCSGVVEAVGEDVTQYKQGDTVFTVRSVTGTCAEYNVAEESQTFPLNTDKLSFKQGAGLGVPFFTAYRALVTRAQAKNGETILIHGASGGVGTLCVQIAKHLGLKVLATAGSDAGLQIVKDCGADFTYNHHTSGYVEKIMEDTADKGVNIVVEMLANINLQRDLDILSKHGRVVIVGNRGTIEINPRSTMAKESSIVGCMLGNSTEGDWAEGKKAVIQYQSEGWLQPVTSTEYTMSEVPQAHIDIMNTKGSAGSLVIKISSNQ